MIILTAFRERNELWVRIFCYIGILAVLIIGTYKTCILLRLRHTATEVPVHKEILQEGNKSYIYRTSVFMRAEPDSTYSLLDCENHLLADSIRSWDIRHIGINRHDTFDAIEYVSFRGDTLLYDMYLREPVCPDLFLPHRKEVVYWEFNYNNL